MYESESELYRSNKDLNKNPVSMLLKYILYLEIVTFVKELAKICDVITMPLLVFSDSVPQTLGLVTQLEQQTLS